MRPGVPASTSQTHDIIPHAVIFPPQTGFRRWTQGASSFPKAPGSPALLVPRRWHVPQTLRSPPQSLSAAPMLASEEILAHLSGGCPSPGPRTPQNQPSAGAAGPEQGEPAQQAVPMEDGVHDPSRHPSNAELGAETWSCSKGDGAGTTTSIHPRGLWRGASQPGVVPPSLGMAGLLLQHGFRRTPKETPISSDALRPQTRTTRDPNPWRRRWGAVKGWVLGAITLFRWLLGLRQVGGEPEEA